MLRRGEGWEKTAKRGERQQCPLFSAGDRGVLAEGRTGEIGETGVTPMPFFNRGEGKHHSARGGRRKTGRAAETAAIPPFCHRRAERARGEKDWQRAVDNPGGLWYFGATAKSKKAQKGTADQTGPYREAPVGERREGNRVEGPWPGGSFRRRSPRSCAVKPKRGSKCRRYPTVRGERVVGHG